MSALPSSRRKIAAARLSIATAVTLAAVKLVAGILTGSLAVIASAIDSTLDILMSGVNFFAIRQAEQPADESHPFGHGKFETLATLFQALIIAASGSWIVIESIHRLIDGAALQRVGQGALVLLASAIVSVLISRHLRKVGRETESSALEADALHFAMDIYTNLALMAGLVILSFVELPWLDPLMSLLVACYILYEAFKLIRHALREVLDAELPDAVRHEVLKLVEIHKGDLLDVHNLRTRRAGSQKIMDFHLTVCKHLTVEQAHSIADHLEERIREQIAGSDVTIHIEPCQRADCPGYEKCHDDPTRHPV
jgi:cation diffusion facilitator family transporter